MEVPTAFRSPRAKSPLRMAAWATALAMLPLVVVGSGVTTKGAGMAFPDWPTSNGYVINPPHWTKNENTLFEHGHRLLGWAVGFLAIISALLNWKAGGNLRILSIATLLAICIQGLLGGIRVKTVSIKLAMIHGIWAQVCLTFAFLVVLLASPHWSNLRTVVAARAAGFYQKLCACGTVAVLIQLAFGAAYKHFANTHALIAHLLGAVAVIILLSWIAMWTLEQYPHHPLLLKLGRLLAALIGTQMVLGGLAFLIVVMGAGVGDTLRWVIPGAHVIVGALLLACTAAMMVCSLQLSSANVRSAPLATDPRMVTR